jgi:site-specific DNA recombinase
MRAAIYARFSTDKQSEASIEDQFRVCERLAERNGFRTVARFRDAAISGGTVDRPGYRALLQAARRHEFDVIVAEDTSRLWRLLAEQAPRLAELADLGVHVVTHDLDTRQESAAVLSAVVGSMAEQYRKEIGRRTRRGLEGKARQGKPAGGRAYGYVPASMSASGSIEVDAAQADVVRQIFTWYANGWSPKAIARELNRGAVLSPGASWKRAERRAGGWVVSAIAGDIRRGIGILNNELYRGRVIWNRMRWQRSAADSSKRRAVPNPPSEWVTRDDESLRIVPQALWDRVKARQAGRRQKIGSAVRAGVQRDRAQRPGREPKFPFSGLLKCGTCGASFVMAGRDHYCCSSRAYGGTSACANDAYLRRTEIEVGLLSGIKRELAAPDLLKEMERRYRARRKQESPQRDETARRAKLEREIASLVDAVTSGALRGSPAIAQRLEDKELELAELKSRPQPLSVDKLLPQLGRRCREAVGRLEVLLARDPQRARLELREHVGPIRVRATAEEIVLESSREHMEAALLGNSGPRQIRMVAGACFGSYLEVRLG